MRKLQVHWLVLVALVALAAWSQGAWAAGPFPQIFDFVPEDTYVPDSHPIDNPSNVFGAPPNRDMKGNSSTYTTQGGGQFTTGFVDGRSGSYGLAVPVGNSWEAGAGLAAVPIDPNNQYFGTVYHSGVPTNVGKLVVWPQYGYGPTYRASRTNAQAPGPSPPPWDHQAQFQSAAYLGDNGHNQDNMGHQALWSQQMDLYLDPNLPKNGAIQYWWTNSITGTAGIPAYGYYATESGINPIHNADGTYRIQVTQGSTIADGLTAGQWVTVEIRWDFSNTKSSVVHNVWNIDPVTGLHTSLLGSYTIPAGSVFLNPDSDGLQGGSRTHWMPYWTTSGADGYTGSSFHATIDNAGVGIPIGLYGRKGDINNDTYVDGDDNTYFTQALVADAIGDLDTLAASLGYSFADLAYRADINSDGYIDGDDISDSLNGYGYVQLQTSDGVPGPAAGGVVNVPEPSSFALLALGGLGVLVARQRKLKTKKANMKGLTLGLVILVAALAVFTAGTAEAGRMYLSLSSTSPTEDGTGFAADSSTDAGTNPTLILGQGGSGALYLWWDPAIDAVSGVNERLTSMGHDIVSSNPILARVTYNVDNPSVAGTPRWQGTTSGSGATTYMVDNATATAPSPPSDLGFQTGDGTYDPVSQSWRVASLTFTNDSLGTGTTQIRIGVGSGKINFTTSPTNGRTVFMGFGDAGIAGNSSVNGSNTTSVADATVIVAVPEPATFAMLGMGAVGLAFVARRRRKA